jgi:hypothetical protein
MDRLVRVMAAGVTSGLVLGIATMLVMRRHQVSPPALVFTSNPISRPAAPVAEETCSEAVVLTLQTHSGTSVEMEVQDLDGKRQASAEASAGDGQFTTACYRGESPDSSPDPFPQLLKVCKPATFVVHITGNGKGRFDLQAKPFPEVARPTSPLLLCNYAVDGDRVYDWVLRYQGGPQPTVFLLGSRGDPDVRP